MSLGAVTGRDGKQAHCEPAAGTRCEQSRDDPTNHQDVEVPNDTLGLFPEAHCLSGGRRLEMQVSPLQGQHDAKEQGHKAHDHHGMHAPMMTYS